jgi:glucose dehydrogenase
VVIAFSTLSVAQRPDPSSPSGKDFVIVGGNVFNHRYSSLSRINKNTIKQLGAAWMVHVAPGRNGLWMQATPIVVDGVMYITTGHITARDARTGALKWQFPNLQVTFVKNGAGAVTGIVLRQGAFDSTGPRVR